MKEHILAIVGIGEAGMPVINKSKEMGIKTLGLGMGDSLGKDLVDIFEEVNIFDVEGMAKVCRKHGVTGVIGPSEVSAEPAALLAHELGLPGNRVEGGFFARNKYLMRKKVSELDTVFQPEYCLYEKGMEIKYPVVVKALDSCGKQGITLAKSEADFKVAVNEAEKISSNGRALVEEYLEGGQEYSVECISFNGEYTVVQVTEKDSSGPPHFAETGHHQPANVSDEMRKNIEIAAEDILRVIGIDCGMAHLEVKIINGKIYFIEVGARGGGGHIAETLTSLSTDCDYYKAAIECSLGEYMPHEIHNISYCGLYYHIKNNAKLDELFKQSKNADWLYKSTVQTDEYPDAIYYCDREAVGYIIYNSDHKIGMKDIVEKKKFSAEIINEYPNAFEILWNHNREIGRTLSDDELTDGINKFLENGNSIAVLDGNHIIAYSNLYCNNYETLEAYICNVYVLNEYRGCGLSNLLIEKSIEICRKNKFKSISLHVDNNNAPAISLYKKFNFEMTGKTNPNNDKSIEMKKML